MRTLVVCAVLGGLVGCTSDTRQPTGYYPRPQPQPQGQPEPNTPLAPTPEPAMVTPAPPLVDHDTPIAPNQTMPPGSLSTNAIAELDLPITVIVDARSDLYSSGAAAADPSRGGVMPAILTLPKAGDLVVTVTRASGKVGCGTADPPSGAEGGACAGGSTDLESAGGISGVIDGSSTQFLAGVVLAARPPTTAPDRLDFSKTKLGHGFKKLAPRLGQLFYLGDGKSKAFPLPYGAQRLYLGIADGYGFHGAPGAYGDNTGGFEVTVVVSQKR